MITYQEFKNKWNGKHCEMGGSANAQFQCTDLSNSYIKEVLGLPIVLGTNAVDFPKKCLPPNYEYILNSPTAVPIQGDIMIYKSPDGIGHIDIFDNGNDSKFVAFSQNWPLKSVCKLVNHTYTGTYTVVGWLRGKVQNVIIDDMTDEQKRILEFLNGKTEGQVREAFGALQDIPKLNKEISDLKSYLKDLTERIEQLEADAKANNTLIESYQSTILTAKDTESNLRADIQTWKNRYESKCKETVDKYSALELIKLGLQKLFIKK